MTTRSHLFILFNTYLTLNTGMENTWLLSQDAKWAHHVNMAFLCKNEFLHPQIKPTTYVFMYGPIPPYTEFKVRFLSSSEFRVDNLNPFIFCFPKLIPCPLPLYCCGHLKTLFLKTRNYIFQHWLHIKTDETRAPQKWSQKTQSALCWLAAV